MKVNLFGQLKELVPGGSLDAPDLTGTGQLKKWIEARLPLLAELPYLVAVDRKIVDEEIPIGSGQDIAILPPYSGG